jgi:hypothetical protein
MIEYTYKKQYLNQITVQFSSVQILGGQYGKEVLCKL